MKRFYEKKTPISKVKSFEQRGYTKITEELLKFKEDKKIRDKKRSGPYHLLIYPNVNRGIREDLQITLEKQTKKQGIRVLMIAKRKIDAKDEFRYHIYCYLQLPKQKTLYFNDRFYYKGVFP